MKYLLVVITMVFMFSCETKNVECEKWQAKYDNAIHGFITAETIYKTAVATMESVCDLITVERLTFSDACDKARIAVNAADIGMIAAKGLMNTYKAYVDSKCR